MKCEDFEAKLRRMRCAVNSCLSLRTLFDIMMTIVAHDGPIEFGSSQSKDAFITKFGKGEDKQH